MDHERRRKPNIPREPLISEFAHDRDMVDLIEYFVGEMQTRVAYIERAWSDQDISKLREFAHQLKGAAAGYGFPQITDSAAELEEGLDQEAAAADLAERVEALIGMCRRATTAP